MTHSNWFGSKQRDIYMNTLRKIPKWKRLLLCFLSRKDYVLARSAAKVSLQAVLVDDDLFYKLVRISDEYYAKIYGLEDLLYTEETSSE